MRLVAGVHPRAAAVAALVTAGAATLATLGADRLSAQVPTGSEVRQLVTFRFSAGRSGEAIGIFRERAIPLYERDQAMVSFRGFREVESPVPLDLIVVSSFRGMAGMDESNAELRRLAEREGTSIGAIYGEIGALAESHTDEFVEMMTELNNGDPTSKPLVAFVWYRAAPNQADVVRRTIERRIVPWERDEGIPTATGRFLVSDGWDYLRILGFDSLGDYQAYWNRADDRIESYTSARREVILAPVPELRVR